MISGNPGEAIFDKETGRCGPSEHLQVIRPLVDVFGMVRYWLLTDSKTLESHHANAIRWS